MGLWRKPTLLVALAAAIAAAPVNVASSEGTVSSPSDCSLIAADEEWIDRALMAWQMARHQIAGIDEIGDFQAVFFSTDCMVTSSNALTRGSMVHRG